MNETNFGFGEHPEVVQAVNAARHELSLEDRSTIIEALKDGDLRFLDEIIDAVIATETDYFDAYEREQGLPLSVDGPKEEAKRVMLTRQNYAVMIYAYLRGDEVNPSMEEILDTINFIPFINKYTPVRESDA